MKVKTLFFLLTFFVFVCLYSFCLLDNFYISWRDFILLFILYSVIQAIFYAWDFYNFYSSWSFKDLLVVFFYIFVFLLFIDILAILSGWESLRIVVKLIIFYLPLDFFLRWLLKMVMKLFPKKKIAFLGESSLCIHVADRIANGQTPWDLVAFFMRKKSASLPIGRQILWFSWSDIYMSVAKLKLDLLVWEDPLPLDGFSCIALPEEILDLVPNSSLVDFIVNDYHKVPVKIAREAWLQAFLAPIPACKFYIKRIFDVLLSFCLLPFILPIMVVVAFLTKITSPGKIIYTQLREGYQGKPFTIYKFRSMSKNAEVHEAKWAQSNDSRVTSWGRIMRKLRLDELPQIWNILKGDMSFVGPRPERPEFTKLLSEKIPFYAQRNRVKPGLTGWAQVNYPYGASIDDAVCKTEYDLYYVHNPSLWMDCKILIKTLQVVLTGQGQ